jgi:LysM repeat protein
MKKRFTFPVLLFWLNIWSNQITRIQYIDQWKEVAQQNMREFNIPASIILAQGILESGSGNSDLARKANNHFGIKCHASWTGAKFYKDDDEKGECFRSYPHGMDSYRDHALFLTTGKRYESLFSLNIADYKSWAHGLKKAGYATHAEYAQNLIRIIEENELYRFDKTEQLVRYDVKPQATGSKNIKANDSSETITIGLQTTIINRVKCVIVQPGQTLYKISLESGVSLRQLYKYNDFIEGKEVLTPGEIVYLQPKRAKSFDKELITVQGNDTTLRAISQAHGVKLKKLMRKNKIDDPDAILKARSKVRLS